jgi:cation transporter-like permease
VDFALAAQRWHDFFLLVGTAAATLIGLMFVAISFAVGSTAERTRKDVDAWVTPWLVYFAEVFLIAAVMLAPVSTLVQGCVLGGLLASNLPWGLMRLRYLHAQHAEERIPTSVWVWQMLLPLLGQLVLALGAVGFLQGDARALGVCALSVIVLLVVALRNAWYLVIYLIEQR